MAMPAEKKHTILWTVEGTDIVASLCRVHWAGWLCSSELRAVEPVRSQVGSGQDGSGRDVHDIRSLFIRSRKILLLKRLSLIAGLRKTLDLRPSGPGFGGQQFQCGGMRLKRIDDELDVRVEIHSQIRSPANDIVAIDGCRE